jgi:hypothetical protein
MTPPIPPADLEALERFMRLTEPDPNTGCWLWSGTMWGTHGYGRFWFHGRDWTSHRLAWELFRGPIPTDDNPNRTVCVLHRCDTPLCVNPGHLFLGTREDNNHDMAAKGRANIVRGTRKRNAKLTEETVRNIRRRAAQGCSLRGMGREYGVSENAIRLVVSRVGWPHVT